MQTNKAATKERRKYQSRKAAGFCPSCGDRPPEEGYAQCNPCRIRKNKNSAKTNRKVYRTMVALRICPLCKEREPMIGKKWCGACAEGHTERMADLRSRRRAEGRCTRCGNMKPCEKCLARGRQKTALYKRRKRERLAANNDGQATRAPSRRAAA